MGLSHPIPSYICIPEELFCTWLQRVDFKVAINSKIDPTNLKLVWLCKLRLKKFVLGLCVYVCERETDGEKEGVHLYAHKHGI